MCQDGRGAPARCFLLLHLTVESLPLFEDLHEFVVDLITVQLFEYVLLMLKLVLWLPGLLCSLLLLDQGEGILGLVDAGISGLGVDTL